MVSEYDHGFRWHPDCRARDSGRPIPHARKPQAAECGRTSEHAVYAARGFLPDARRREQHAPLSRAVVRKRDRAHAPETAPARSRCGGAVAVRRAAVRSHRTAAGHLAVLGQLHQAAGTEGDPRGVEQVRRSDRLAGPAAGVPRVHRRHSFLALAGAAFPAYPAPPCALGISSFGTAIRGDGRPDTGSSRARTIAARIRTYGRAIPRP